MIRSRRKSGTNWMVLLILGVLAGLIVLILDRIESPPAAAPFATPRIVPSVTPFVESASNSPQMTVIAENIQVAVGYEAIENAELFIPDVAINARIIQVFLDGTSWDVSSLGMNVGHLQGTNWVDEGGNVVLSGHVEMRDGRAGVFAGIINLSIGNRVFLRQNGVQFEYAVTRIASVKPDDLTPLYPTENDQLTLITCDDYDFWSNAYESRTIVVAERIS